MSTKQEKQEEVAAAEAELLTPEIKTLCSTTIETAMSVYWKKGGVADLKGKLQAVQQPFEKKLYDDMHAIAEACYREAGGDSNAAIPIFEGACYQMKHRAMQIAAKQGMEDATIVQVLPAFTPTKAQLKDFFKLGKDLFATEPVKIKNDETGEETTVDKRLYPSMTEVRRAVSNNRRDSKSAGATGTVGKASVGIDGIADILKLSSASLRAVLVDMNKQLKGSSEEAQNHFAIALNDAVSVLVKFRAAEDVVKSTSHIERMNAEKAAPAVGTRAAKEKAKRGGTGVGVAA